MKVCAIDPGPNNSAYVIFDGQIIIDKGIEANNELLEKIWNKDTILPFDTITIEKIASYGLPVGESVFLTCIWTGRFIEAASSQSIPYSLIERLKVKMALCHDSRAKDPHIRQRLLDLIGPQGSKKEPGPTYGIKKDEWAALALAVCWFELNSRPRDDRKTETARKRIWQGINDNY